MPSSVYRITITNSGGLAAPSDGFIDNMKTEFYLSDLELPPSDFTMLLSEAKRRANLRYREIILQFAMIGNISVDEASILTPAATYKTEATSFTFTVLVENGDGSLVTWDELNPGQTLTVIPALTRVVARALTWTQTLNADVFDPTGLVTIENAFLRPRFGVRIAPLTVGAISVNLTAATSLITVTPIIQH